MEFVAPDLLVLVRSAVLLVHTMGSCDDPLTGDDGASTGVSVAVIEADLPGPPAQCGLHSPDYPRQLRSCPTLCTEIHSSKRSWIGQKVLQLEASFTLSASDMKPL